MTGDLSSKQKCCMMSVVHIYVSAPLFMDLSRIYKSISLFIKGGKTD